jgi:coproporphyrinogen III oxidase
MDVTASKALQEDEGGGSSFVVDGDVVAVVGGSICYVKGGLRQTKVERRRKRERREKFLYGCFRRRPPSGAKGGNGC